MSKKIEETIDINVCGKLPSSRGKSYILRILSIYNDLFFSMYGFYPQISIPRLGKDLKELIQSRTELQIATLLICFFNWSGMSGDNDFERDKLIKNTHNINWFFNSVNTYEAYMRNVYKLDFDNDEKVKEFVGNYMLKLNK